MKGEKMSLLNVENLKASVEGIVLDGVSFEIDKKGIYAILGKSSEEKNMLARVLAGTVEASDGKIFYKDEEFVGENQIKLKSKIGYMPCKCFLYPDMTVYETLDFTGCMRKVSKDKRIRQIKEAIEILELSSVSEVLVKDLNTVERKKLLLANALMGNPRVIIFDEPTTGLSPSDSEIICDVISMLKDRKAVILFTDKLSVANDMADYIGIISRGKMVLWSTLDDIRENLDGAQNALSRTFIAFSSESEVIK